MLNQWTREHDAVIAEKCDGQKAPLGKSPLSRSSWEKYLPNYNTDIAACIRAAEAWRKQDEMRRSYGVISPVAILGSPLWEGYVNWWDRGTVADVDSSIGCDGPTPAAALAWALYKAVTQ